MWIRLNTELPNSPYATVADSYDIVMLKRSYYQMNRREEAFIRYLQAQL